MADYYISLITSPYTVFLFFFINYLKWFLAIRKGFLVVGMLIRKEVPTRILKTIPCYYIKINFWNNNIFTVKIQKIVLSRPNFSLPFNILKKLFFNVFYAEILCFFFHQILILYMICGTRAHQLCGDALNTQKD